ncbi:lytic transglycosylase domain-containing protein [Roseateles violae]|uniref:Transglycosylase SLT domain-containing protein n=1 Tax=Roseateles violae TaxID=3058042 RepID=A0ABT8DTH5_9BURK|nr:lytic transglycosylase domain-containing protein [Pelomonas sp. PFR6]MDN3921366.1 transglycosylase SLT domain-containing protein [Pelomonas sp. PFR6]
MSALLSLGLLGTPAQAQISTATAPAQAASPDLAVEAREALRQKDRKRLAELNQAAQQQRHPLAAWIDYWELGLRLAEVSQPEVEAFYARWPGSYVEDRMRNDWLLELGRRRDWKNFAADYPRFQMRDDREVLCYALLTEHLAGKKVLEQARSTWLAQRDGDDGCQLLASTLFDAKLLTPGDVWLKLRLAIENQRPRAAKQAAALFDRPVELAVAEIQDNAGKYLSRKARTGKRTQAELTTLALLRVAANDPDQAAALLKSRWERQLPADLAAWAWGQVGRSAAFRLQADASEHYEYALKLHGKGARQPEWSEDTIAWAVRSALRGERWSQALRAIKLFGAAEQRDPTWQYWQARALLATAAEGPPGEAIRAEARGLLQPLVSPMTFYGRLAADELGQALTLPAAPAALTPAEREQARAHPGLRRALLLMSLELRNEGVREWNFSLRGMGDRELLAAAQEACEREIWDRCINSSDRTRHEIDLAQRYPTPFRKELLAKAREVGIDPAYVYGLIRQESRFVLDARSHVGASGLMQVMPATAKWTAKKVGIAYSPALMTDRDFNLTIGASYLKLALDDFGGSMALAAAAYNAGPSRPRRWREGPLLDAAIWTENIPFNETRDYVKKVLLNTTIYSQLLGAEGPGIHLRTRLGRQIGPRASGADLVPAEQP